MSDVQSIMLTSSIKSNDIESFEWSKASKACIGTVKTDFADMHVYICDLIEPAMSNLSGRVISLSGQTYSGCPYRFYTCMNLAKWVVLQGCHMASCYRRDQVWDTEGWQGLCRSDVAWAGCEQARWKALAESLLNTKKTVIQSSTIPSVLQDLDLHTCEAIIFRLLHLCCKLLRIPCPHSRRQRMTNISVWGIWGIWGIYHVMTPINSWTRELTTVCEDKSRFLAIVRERLRWDCDWNGGHWLLRDEMWRKDKSKAEHLNDVRNNPGRERLWVPGHSLQALNSQSFGLSHLM